MSDDSEDKNEKAIKRVVKKHVSDVFGEEEKPAEPTYYERGGYPVSKEQADEGWRREQDWRKTGFSSQTSYDLWKRDNSAFQRTGQVERDNLTAASWGNPADRAAAASWGKRDKAMRPEYDDAGNPTGINFTEEGWKKLRGRIFRTLLREVDWERVVLMPDDNVLLEQMVDTVMRRGRFQLGQEGNAYSHGTLVQVPISIGDNPPADPQALPASSIDLKDDGWGKPDDDEVIDVSGGKDNE